MALRSGIDTVAIATYGVYTETYVSSTGGGNIASLYASKGFLESAPNIAIKIVTLIMQMLNQYDGGTNAT